MTQTLRLVRVVVLTREALAVILADASVWISHFRGRPSRLDDMLNAQAIAIHDHVLGEIAVGSLKDRAKTLGDLANLPRAPLASEEEVRTFIESRKVHARGIGYSDAHLLAAVVLDGAMTLWTEDSRLALVADELGVAFKGP